MTREEHLEWCKKRALEFLPQDPVQGFTSMFSDLAKHPELENHVGIRIGVGFMMLPGWISNPEEVRRWIVAIRLPMLFTRLCHGMALKADLPNRLIRAPTKSRGPPVAPSMTWM